MDDLVKKAKNGDIRAQKEIFETLTVRFSFFAKRYIGEDDYKDIVQEACLTILEKFKSEEFPAGFRAWAYRVLKNKIGNYLSARGRKLQRESFLESNFVNEPFSEEKPGLRTALIDCLREIGKSNHRYARVLNFTYQGYDTRSICRKLNIKLNHYYVLLNRGRSLLLGCLSRKGMM